jgi:hypothetical protein
MESICALIDAQGYFIDGKFHISELAISPTGHSCVQTWSVCLPKDFEEMSKKDKITNEYIRRNITGLPYKPDNEEHISHTKIKAFIYMLWSKYRSGSERNKFGIKNPNLAKLLTELEIPYIEIEMPSIKDLQKYYTFHYECDRHTDCSQPRCAVQKVALMKIWLSDKQVFDNMFNK